METGLGGLKTVFHTDRLILFAQEGEKRARKPKQHNLNLPHKVLRQGDRTNESEATQKTIKHTPLIPYIIFLMIHQKPQF